MNWLKRRRDRCRHQWEHVRWDGDFSPATEVECSKCGARMWGHP